MVATGDAAESEEGSMTTTEVRVQTVDGVTHTVTLSGDGIEHGSMRAKTAGCVDVIVEETNPHMAAMAAMAAALLWRWRVESIVVARQNHTQATDAATLAFDEIAALCGCPEWDYPGQIVRDVQTLVRERDLARLGTAPRKDWPTTAEVLALMKAQKASSACFLTCYEGPDHGDGAQSFAFDLVRLDVRPPLSENGPPVVRCLRGAARLDSALWWLPLGPKGPVAWPVVASLVAAGAPTPADVATLVEAAEFTQAANAAAWEALFAAAPELGGASIDRHTGLRWGLARMHEREMGSRELWVESRSGQWRNVCRLYDEPFVRVVSPTLAVAVEEDDERGNVLHLVDPQTRCDDVAESERKTFHE